jgi:hypothetical protein
MSVALDKHCLCEASSSFGDGRLAADVLCLVEGCSAAVLNVRENCISNSSEGSSGKSENWPSKMSGEPDTA